MASSFLVTASTCKQISDYASLFFRLKSTDHKYIMKNFPGTSDLNAIGYRFSNFMIFWKLF